MQCSVVLTSASKRYGREECVHLYRGAAWHVDLACVRIPSTGSNFPRNSRRPRWRRSSHTQFLSRACWASSAEELVRRGASLTGREALSPRPCFDVAGGHRNWKDRYFVFTDHLYYYPTQQVSAALGRPPCDDRPFTALPCVPSTPGVHQGPKRPDRARRPQLLLLLQERRCCDVL